MVIGVLVQKRNKELYYNNYDEQLPQHVILYV